MGMFTKLPNELEEVDVIIAGGGYPSRLIPKRLQPRLTRLPGGLAGCVVAGRLAEADPGLTILVIEQGPNNYQEDQVVYPALYPRNLFPSSKYTLFWQGNQAPQLANRRPIVPSGGTLGGGYEYRDCLSANGAMLTGRRVQIFNQLDGVYTRSATRLRLLEHQRLVCRRATPFPEEGVFQFSLQLCRIKQTMS